MEYFKDSVARDENGNLKVLYHGTKSGGFHTFAITKDIGYFFTDNPSVAKTYSNTSDVTSYNVSTWEEAIKLAKKVGYNVSHDRLRNTYRVTDRDYNITNYNESELSEFAKHLKRKAKTPRITNYEVYLNLKNPLIINGNG